MKTAKIRAMILIGIQSLISVTQFFEEIKSIKTDSWQLTIGPGLTDSSQEVRDRAKNTVGMILNLYNTSTSWLKSIMTTDAQKDRLQLLIDEKEG